MGKSTLELNDTSELMISKDHGDRLLAEYMQLDIRMNGLEAMLYKWDEAIRKGIEAREVLGFEPTTSFEVLYEQLVHMRGYHSVLIRRMNIEGVPIGNYEEDYNE